MDRKWMPAPGEYVNISLPDELVRATVVQCPDGETVIAALDVNPPISKTHGYRQNDVVAARRTTDEFGRELWKVVDAA